MSEELLEKGEADWSTYNPGSHKDIKKIIQDNINSVCANYVAIGFYLNVVNNRKLYEEDGYSGIGEYAAAEYGIQEDKCSYLRKIANKFCIPNSPALLPEYRGFKIHKLREMLYLDDEQLKQVAITSTVAEIRDIRKPEPEKVAISQVEPEPVSPYGLTKSVYPPDSLIASSGCGNKHDCFCCAMDCNIRQKDRYCVEAPLGNPFPCTTMNTLECVKNDIGNECMFINHELAFHRAGDHEPVPCCKECKNQCEHICKRAVKEQKPSGKCIHRPEFPCTLPEASKIAKGDGVNCNAKCCWGCEKRNGCGYQCNSSALRPKESKFSIEEIVRYSVPHITIHEKLKVLCKYNIPGNTDKVMKLMLEQDGGGNFAGKWSFSENGFTYTASDTRQTKTISWEEYCDAFRRDNKYLFDTYLSTVNQPEPVTDTQEPENDADETVDNEPDTVDDLIGECETCGREVKGCCDYLSTPEDFCVLGDKWEPKAERSCSNCNYDTMSRDDYFSEHPDTKEFPCDNCGMLNNWAPVLNKPEMDVDEEFLKCYHNPEFACTIEDVVKVAATRDDVDCNGVCCWDCNEDCDSRCNPSAQKLKNNEPEQVETVEADIIQSGHESPDYCGRESGINEIIRIKPTRNDDDVNCPAGMSPVKPGCEWFVKRDGLSFSESCAICNNCWESYIWRLINADRDKLEPVKVETPKQIQPELPILKNNDQRKDFIDAYETWPIWIDLKETGERYYRYNLTDKVAIVVKVSKQHVWKNYKETADIDYRHEEYYLIGAKTEYYSDGTIIKEDDTRTFYECSSNKSALVDFLKDFQKKKGA